MIDESYQINEKDDQEKIKKHSDPERPDPDKNVADNGQIDLFHESAYNIRKREKKKNDEVGNSQPGSLRKRLPASNENIIIYRSIDGKHDTKKNDEVDGFHILGFVFTMDIQ